MRLDNFPTIRVELPIFVHRGRVRNSEAVEQKTFSRLLSISRVEINNYFTSERRISLIKESFPVLSAKTVPGAIFSDGQRNVCFESLR